MNATILQKLFINEESGKPRNRTENLPGFNRTLLPFELACLKLFPLSIVSSSMR